MTTLTFFKTISISTSPTRDKRNAALLSAFFLGLMALTVFQDFLASNRGGYAFYLSESILFKTVWLVFIPLLTLLRILLKSQDLESWRKTCLCIVAPILTHLVVLSFVFMFFSVLFYHGRYDLYKILSYTFANDFYKLVLIYSGFVLGYRYHKLNETTTSNTPIYLKHILITTGKNNVVIDVNDIFQITAATPYVDIHLEHKKHLHTATLKSLSSQLNPTLFVRIHKSTMVNMDTVESFNSRLNGDYDILLKNGDSLRLSRTYVKDFKNNFRIIHQVST